MNEPDTPGGSAPVPARGFEVGVGLLLLLLGAIVVVDSWRVGAGWADDGPRAGYFPFYIGLALMVSSAWIVFAQLRDWKRIKAFAQPAQLRDVRAILVPMLLHGVLIKLIGLYVASALLIAWFMRRHGQHRTVTTASVSVGVPLVFFVVFERWFLVPLPKGPLEALFGY